MLCSKWWEISKEFFNLHKLYSNDAESIEISRLIWQTQILLVVEVGLVAVTTLLLNN